MLLLPTKEGETIVGDFDKYFAPHARPNKGDFLLYNPHMDKMVVVSIRDKPEYVVSDISKTLFGRFTKIAILKL